MGPAINPRRRLLLAGALAWLAAPAAATEPRPLELGVIPYLPTATLIAGHQPLRRHLESTFGRPVHLSTAPDLLSFHRRTLAGDYDVVVTGPPLAWHAHREGRLVWIAEADRRLRILLMVAREGPVQHVAELRGQVVATIGPISLTAQVAAARLAAQGLQTGRTVTLRHERTPYNAAQAVLLGEATAAAVPDVSLPQFPAAILDGLRVLDESEDLPSVAFLARRAPDLPGPEEVQRALFRFARHTGEGRRFLREFSHDGLHAPNLAAMRRLDPYLPAIRREMGR